MRYRVPVRSPLGAKVHQWRRTCAPRLALLACAFACAARPAARAAGPTAPPESTEEAAERLRVLERRLAQRPADAEVTLQMGLLLEKVGDGLRAQQYLARALRLRADGARVLPALVRVSLALGDYRGAIHYGGVYEELLGLACDGRARGEDPCVRLAEARVVLGELWSAFGDPADARGWFDRALRADARAADAYLGLARLEREVYGNLDAARDALRRGLAAVGDGPGARDIERALAALDREKGAP